MQFHVYFPPQSDKCKVPLLIWLSDREENGAAFMQESGILHYASEHGLAILAPDTSPREIVIPDAHNEDGLGPGHAFYVDATQSPWAYYYNMYGYISQELPALMQQQFPQFLPGFAISGFGMGGHGALILGLRNPEVFRSISAFAPICTPMHCRWGEKALSHYLGYDRDKWKPYDAVALIEQAQSTTPLLIEQGTEDAYLTQQLKLSALETMCARKHHPLTVNLRQGYDHSYQFVATFLQNHVQYHLNTLHAESTSHTSPIN